MPHFCGVHRPPRAGIDPVDSADAASAVIRLAVTRPMRSEVVVLVLDGDRRGAPSSSSTAPTSPTPSSRSWSDWPNRSSTRRAPPPSSSRWVPGGGQLDDDADRWLEASDAAEQAGVELLEWFVISDDLGPPTAWCPLYLLAEPPRWS